MRKPFDPRKKRERLAKRITKAWVDQRPVNETKFQEMIILEKLERVVEWCAGRGIEVFIDNDEDHGGIWIPDIKEIVIDSRLTAKKQLYTLLHECGHALIDSTTSKVAELRFGDAYSVEEMARTDVDKINIVAVELEAWARGLQMAERLGINIDTEEYNKERVRAIKTYMEWALSSRKKL
jgi:hypothetical protein